MKIGCKRLMRLAIYHPWFAFSVILKHYYGYSYEEIARMMRIAEGTVKSRVHNGLKRLRKELQENETE